MIKWNEYTWYSKSLAFLILVILLPIWIFYLGIQFEKTRNFLKVNSEIYSDEGVEVSSVITNKSFNFSDFFSGEIADRFSTEIFSIQNGTTTLSFGPPLSDEMHQNRNPGWQVYLNKQKIGEIGGQGLFPFGLIDGRYFIVRTRSVNGCAGQCQAFQLYRIDIIDMNIKPILLPQSVNEKLKNQDEHQFDDVIVFIDKFKIGTGDVPRFVFYISALKEGKYLQLSAKEVYSYSAKQDIYTLDYVLPE